MNLNLQQIGQFIQSCRKELGLTQNEMGERLGVSPQSVSNWERGESLPDVSLLPDLACMLRCSVDSILSGGAGCGGYRRHVTVAQMREALSALNRIGELLGRDHFIYTCIIDALNKRMNTTIEQSFSDPHIFEVFTIEFLLGCISNGDYVDPRDVQSHLQPNKARDYVMRVLNEQGIR
ncbi:MAG: helix-turn-helix domain-containing protein [Clostridia bacterium]|nr:helix-turn-helix domain-containing protein [Clostridia bacterium]